MNFRAGMKSNLYSKTMMNKVNAAIPIELMSEFRIRDFMLNRQV